MEFFDLNKYTKSQYNYIVCHYICIFNDNNYSDFSAKDVIDFVVGLHLYEYNERYITLIETIYNYSKYINFEIIEKIINIKCLIYWIKNLQ